MLLFRWVIALLVPVIVFTLWSGESIINTIISPGTAANDVPIDPTSLVVAAIFTVIFYGAVIALVGYFVASDNGQRRTLEIWLDVLIFALVPLILVIVFGLVVGLALCAVVWPLYFYIRNRIRRMRNATSLNPAENISALNVEERAALLTRASAGGLWFGIAFALVSLVVDLVYFFSGSLPIAVLIWAIVRTIILPVVGYFLGRLGGRFALRYVLSPPRTAGNGNGSATSFAARFSKLRQIEALSPTRAREEAASVVPTALPLRSRGAQRFYLILLTVFVLCYPILDPFLFGSSSAGRIASYADAGRYVILALGLNIVVGFAGLLDLGYVAFFAIGAYAWSMIGSGQFTTLTNIAINPQLWPWFFWPMVIIGALIAAFWGVVLGAPTLRLRGDYLAIVTLGFGEIVPVFFLNLDKYTNGTNGLVGVFSPAFPGVQWSTFTPIPYYYLILLLIGFCLLANVRLRDSRLGRAWVAIREDEIAASSSGINLVRTKLFAFGAGAFFSGIAGVYYAAKLGGVSPENFSFSDSVIYLAMVVIGGLGSIPGVIVGALAVYAINVLVLGQLDVTASDPHNVLYPLYSGIQHFFPDFSFSNVRNLVFGVILVSVMIFRPEGLIPSARRKRELHTKPDEPQVLDELDAPPASPGFQAEMRIE
jgi:ABC-type branched-subunit amino acid transport system permease subunit